ncbi:MAG TPA: hypothetical protein P5534_12685 [Candidatus Paceibacterota bacterium]|nr:hypothetical protein [Candidatus Paceibacterota bacterium]HRZ55787.1 hypothetical protein [Candidatus Paceibacterota bacterium]
MKGHLEVTKLAAIAAAFSLHAHAFDLSPTQHQPGYGAKSHIGTFSDSLMEEANKSGWTVISMKEDWRTVFAFGNE